MSFLRKLFGADPGQQLDKARRAMAARQFAEALDLFGRARDGAGGDGELRAAAGDGVREASLALVGLNLREAEVAADADDPETAMSHLETALELCPDGAPERERVIARMEMLDDALRAAAEPKALFTTEGAVGEDEDPEIAWENVLGTLDDEVAEDYRDRGAAFRDAILALNDGDAAAAAEQLEPMLADEPDDPLLLFELGRAYLALERWDEAITALAAAREEIGFEPLDRVGMLQVALLEADALLGAGRLQDARELLDVAIDERGDEVSMLFLRGRVERALEDHDAVEETIGRVMRISPQLVEAPMELAASRLQRDDPAGAADALEQGIKRHCGTGTCQLRPLSVPAGRMLVRCYLDMETKLDDAEDLLMQVRGSLEGHVAWADHVLWGRLYRLRGDDEGLAEARAAALEGAPDDPQVRAEIERQLAAPA